MILVSLVNAYVYIVPLLGLLLISLNKLLAINEAYIEKDGPFECGFTSYNQSRTSYSIGFILIAILFLPFDLEVSSILPYAVSMNNTGAYGISILIYFLFILIVGFIYEINSGALYINRVYKYENKELLIDIDNK